MTTFVIPVFLLKYSALSEAFDTCGGAKTRSGRDNTIAQVRSLPYCEIFGIS
jgi:hypothetical protein